MSLVERLDYVLTKEILEEAALAVVPEFNPPPLPKYPPQMKWMLAALAAACLALLLVGIEFEMGLEHYIITGLGILACLIAAAVPWFCQAMNHGVVRFTRYCRKVVHGRLFKAAEPALGSTLRWEFDEDGFNATMLGQTRRVSWTEVRRLRMLPKFWLLDVKVNELFLPTFALTDPIRDFIRRKTSEIGVKVVEK